MSCGIVKNIKVCKGATFLMPIRWGVEPVVFKPIVSIENAANPRVGVPSHGLISGWPVAISNVRGMKEINAPGSEPLPEHYIQCEVVDADNIILTDLNTTDYTPYLSGGFVRYWSIPDVSTITATFTAINKKTGNEVLSFSSDVASVGGGVDKDVFGSLFTLRLEAATTGSITDRQLEYSIRYTNALGRVYGVCKGVMTLT